jgi:hypothetical protein
VEFLQWRFLVVPQPLVDRGDCLVLRRSQMAEEDGFFPIEVTADRHRRNALRVLVEMVPRDLEQCPPQRRDIACHDAVCFGEDRDPGRPRLGAALGVHYLADRHVPLHWQAGGLPGEVE